MSDALLLILVCIGAAGFIFCSTLLLRDITSSHHNNSAQSLARFDRQLEAMSHSFDMAYRYQRAAEEAPEGPFRDTFLQISKQFMDDGIEYRAAIEAQMK